MKFWYEKMLNQSLITIAGKHGDDAKHYQINAVKAAIKESRK
jgi:hypothetical protein